MPKRKYPTFSVTIEQPDEADERGRVIVRYGDTVLDISRSVGAVVDRGDPDELVIEAYAYGIGHSIEVEQIPATPSGKRTAVLLVRPAPEGIPVG